MALGVKNYLIKIVSCTSARTGLPKFPRPPCDLGPSSSCPVLYLRGQPGSNVICTMSQNPQDRPTDPPSLRLPNYRFLHQGRYHPYPTFNRQQGATSQEVGNVEVMVGAVCHVLDMVPPPRGMLKHLLGGPDYPD